MKKKEFIKASNLVHVCHTLSLIEQQVFNLLLAHAYDDLAVKDEHAIALSTIEDYLNAKRGFEHIERILLELSVKVTYIVIDKEGTNQQGFFQFFNAIRVVEGIAYYSYTQSMRAFSVNYRSYAKINLLTQRNFKSKYSLALYELCVDFSGIGQTPKLAVEEFRRYMGIRPSDYASFKMLNHRVVKKAMHEVNSKADFSVKVHYYRSARNVAFLKFTIEKRAATLLTVGSARLTDLEPSDTKSVKLLTSYGVQQALAQEIADKYTLEQINEKISMLKKNTTPIQNPGAWLVKAFKHNWMPSQPAKPIVAPVSKKTVNQVDFTLRDLEKEHLAYLDTRLRSLYLALPEEEKQKLELKFQNWIKANPFASVIANVVTNSRKHFFTVELVPASERDFKQWALTKGYVVEKTGYIYKIKGRVNQI